MTDKAEPVLRKEDADSLVTEALGDKTIHKYHVGRASPLKNATQIYAELGHIELAQDTNFDVNIFTYSLGNMVSGHGYDKKWGRFGPHGSGTDKEGNELFFPDPRWIDDEMVAHASKRTSETDNPLVLAIYYDLIFEHIKARDKRPFAISAIENYLAAAEIQFTNGWDIECQDSLIRAWELSIKIGDNTRIAEVQKQIFAYVDKYASKDNPRFSLELLDALFSQLKRLSSEQRMLLVKTAEDASSKYPDQYHLERAFLEFAQRVYRAVGDKSGELTIELRIIDSLLAEAKFNADHALVEVHFIEAALERVQQIKDPRHEADSLRRRIEEAYERSLPEFKQISAEIKMTDEEIKQIIDHYFVDNDPQETLRRLGSAMSLVPDYQSAEELVKRTMKDFPLQHIIGGATIQGNRRINQHKGGFEINEDHVVSQMGQNLRLTAILRSVLFRELEARSIGAPEISRRLREADFFQYDNFVAIEEGLADYDEGKYFSAVCVLIPQIEEILRRVVYKLGMSTTVTKNGVQQAIKIDHILEKLRLSIGEAVYWYLALLMFDKRGLALRDNVGHGLLTHCPQNEDDARVAIHALLVLSSFKLGYHPDSSVNI